MRIVTANLCVFVLFLLTSACGGARLMPKSAATPAIDFFYEQDGAERAVHQLQGRPLVLVLMQTSDVACQIYMPQLAEAFRRTAGELQYLVLSVDQNDRPLVDAYADAEDLPFSIGLAEPDVADGATSLGNVPLVPATYIIDAKGRIQDAAVGMVKADQIEKVVRRLFKK